MRSTHFLSVGLFLAASFPVAGQTTANSAAQAFSSADLVSAVEAIGLGGRLRLTEVEEEGSKTISAFSLERFEVFTPDAMVTIHGEGGTETVMTAPRNVYYRGTVDGEPDSHVFLSVLEDGAVKGIVTRASGVSFIGSDDAPRATGDGPLSMHRVEQVALDTATGQGFSCASDKLPDASAALREIFGEDPVQPTSGARPSAVQLAQALPARTAKVAIETDYEFYALFNSTTAATNYIAQLIGYDSAVAYIPELGTSLEVSSVSLWTGGAASDPWTVPTNKGTFCGLLQFGRYWNLNHPFDPTQRTLAHFMSGKGFGGGIAWLGVLCNGAFSYPVGSCTPEVPDDGVPVGGGYGFTASLSGAFDANNPGMMWDNMSTAHEIGHNFNSPHSHCYNGIGGNANPIDTCWSGESGCYSGSTSRPSLGGLICSGASCGPATIMSYCHQFGSYSYIGMTFGAAPGYNYGIVPGREAARMNSAVASAVAGGGSCMSLAGPAIATISPAIGSIAGGQAVTISGARFASPATVKLGGASATSVVVVNSSTITAVTPAHLAGSVTILVSNPAVGNVSNGNAELLAGYQYTATPPAPLVVAVSPASGPTTGGTAITITGNNFANGATVLVGSSAATGVVFVNASTLTAVTPAGSGIQAVKVTNPDATNGTLANGFFYANASNATDFYTVSPCRLIDTRASNGPQGGPVLAANATRVFTMAGACGIPSGAKALSMNVTSTNATAGGFLSLYPGNAFALGTSTLSYAAGKDRANNAVVELATNAAGTIGVQNSSAGTVNLVIDVNGYFQ
ncbi:MAG: IPT/TIG domain-containing protein [Acidobacteriota bacterium]